MPTEAQSLLSAGFAVAQALFPAVVVGNGHTVTGVSSPISTGKMMKDQGYDAIADGMVCLSIADAATVNAVDRALLTVDGEPVRVVRVDRSATDPTVEVHFKHQR